jgi:hypothetical protein
MTPTGRSHDDASNKCVSPTFVLGLAGNRFAVQGRDFVKKLLRRCFRREAGRFKRLRYTQIVITTPLSWIALVTTTIASTVGMTVRSVTAIPLPMKINSPKVRFSIWDLRNLPSESRALPRPSGFGV